MSSTLEATRENDSDFDCDCGDCLDCMAINLLRAVSSDVRKANLSGISVESGSRGPVLIKIDGKGKFDHIQIQALFADEANVVMSLLLNGQEVFIDELGYTDSENKYFSVFWSSDAVLDEIKFLLSQ